MSFDDERVRFYFRHREQIEQWAELRSEAAAALDEWMTLLEEDVRGRAREIDPAIVVQALVADAAYPSYRLIHPRWGLRELADPAACIALEWVRGRTTLRGTTTSPYVGLRAPKAHAGADPLRSSEPLRQARIARKDTLSPWWIGYAYVPAPADFPESAEAYRSTLLDALTATWRAYEPGVTSCLARHEAAVP